MKYEMIFGDEKLADKFTNDNSVFIVCRGHGVYFEFESGNAGVNFVANSCTIGDSFYMRRIIKEPKRWTWEDKKVGRLPEVGSIFTYRDETLTCHFIDGDGEIWAHDIDNKIVTPLLRDCRPIETPEEKAARLREEWKNNVIEIHHGKRRKMSTSTFLLDDIYDALLSGELKAPEVE